VRLVDLEGVRFSCRLADDARRLELAEWNASLPDAFDAGARRAAFERYERRLPFRAGAEATLRWIVEESLARRHRWSGTDCRMRRD
jgi:hypothetical protein